MDPEENTPLDERMKRYEHTFRTFLPRRAYTLMRLDIRAAHSYLKHADRPFDARFVDDMNHTAMALCKEIQGARLAYTQSDEISLLITDFDTPSSEPWFGGNVAKLTSLSAATASVFLHIRRPVGGMVQFDSRVWPLSDPVEVANYFYWRQRDAVRNSIQMVGQHYFSQAQLHGKNVNEIQEMLFQEHNVNWNGTDPGCKRGRLTWYTGAGWLTGPAPHFAAEPNNELAGLIPQLPSLWDAVEEKETEEAL